MEFGVAPSGNRMLDLPGRGTNYPGSRAVHEAANTTCTQGTSCSSTDVLLPPIDTTCDDVLQLFIVLSVVGGVTGLLASLFLAAAGLTQLCIAVGHHFTCRWRRPVRRSWAIAGLKVAGRRSRCRRRRGRIRARLLGSDKPVFRHIYVRSRPTRGRKKTILMVCCLVFLATCRVGEADHPGPAGSAAAPAHRSHTAPGDRAIHAEVVDAAWNAVVDYPAPHRDGFRGALAPGHEDPNTDRVPRNAPGLRLRIETINSTGWGPLQQSLLQTNAHAVLAQETWVLACQVPSARKWAKHHGWTSLWAPAALGRKGGANGGVAIFVRKEMGLRGPDVGSHIIEDARAVIGVAEFPGHRPTALVSNYLVDGGKLGEANSSLLEKIAAAVNAQGKDCMAVCGGNFQNSPEQVASHAAIGAMRARVVATTTARGTYRTSQSVSNIDLFVVSERLGVALDKVEPQEGTGVKSHVPIQMVFKERPVGLHTLSIRMPPSLPVERLYGPLRPELDWARVAAAADAALVAARTSSDKALVQKKLNAACEAWADMAEKDIMRVTGAVPPVTGTGGKKPHVR